MTLPVTAVQGSESASFALVNARIYTEDVRRPWATALVVKGDRIVYVGEPGTPDWIRRVQGGVRTYDLKRRFVMPGFIDAHTHPGLTAMLGSGDPTVDQAQMMPAPGAAETLRWLRRYAKAHPRQALVKLGYWDVSSFLPEGPNRRDLDAIWPTTPVVIFDSSGHSTWVNSAMLKKLGIDARTPDLSPGISIIVRGPDGEPTGWIKEWAAMHRLAPLLLPERSEFRTRLTRHLAYLASHGVTTLFDAGNLGLEDSVYGELATLDRAGKLPIRYFGSYHIWDPAQIDHAVAEIRRLQAAYGGRHLRFETVKIHYDGVTELMTAAMLQPYVTDASNRGGVLFDHGRLARFIQELNAEHLNLHLHVVGDRATHEALEAITEVTQLLGRAPAIEITLCHLQVVDPSDIARFRELNVHANFTPHWFGSSGFGQAGTLALGPERAQRDELVATFWRAGANVTFSSDVISSDEIPATNPFVGLEQAMTRTEEAGTDQGAARQRPSKERLTLEQGLAAYTVNGSRQLGISAETGTLAAGQKADFVIVSRDPFKIPPRQVHSIHVDATVLDGEITAGAIR